ncbi:MAG: cupin domain-containing protein [Candidatus Helarchaeota archaeon]
MSEIKKRKPTQEEIEKMLKDWSPWECDVSTFDWEYFSTETAYVIEGEVTVKTDSGEATIKAGDLVTFPKGLKCVWDVKKPIRKVYTFSD